MLIRDRAAAQILVLKGYLLATRIRRNGSQASKDRGNEPLGAFRNFGGHRDSKIAPNELSFIGHLWLNVKADGGF